MASGEALDKLNEEAREKAIRAILVSGLRDCPKRRHQILLDFHIFNFDMFFIDNI